MTRISRTDDPPRWAERLLRVFLEPRDRETITGDLLEEYREVALPTRGLFCARLWYLKQTFSLINGVKLGAVLGVVFGAWILISTFLAPLAEDTPAALASFYGPMFLMWGLAGFYACRRTRRLTHAIKVGATVGFVTFVAFALAALIRVNVFLEVISQRSDWQNLILNYQASGFQSLRTYANYVYVSGFPLTTLIGSVIGAAAGLIGGLLGTVGPRDTRLLSSRYHE